MDPDLWPRAVLVRPSLFGLVPLGVPRLARSEREFRAGLPWAVRWIAMMERVDAP